jgi:alkylation response protein AidB-like acyl-CoA dehydrogenase
MLSERGNGFKIAMNALNVGRIKLAAACLDAQGE